MGSKPGYEIDRDENGLTARDRDVIRLLTTPRTMSEVGATLGHSRQRVSQIANRLAARGHLVKQGRHFVLPPTETDNT